MKYNIVIVVCIVLMVNYFISTARLVAKIIKGKLLLKKARENGEIIIKGKNSVYKVTNYIIAIVMEVIAVFVFGKFLISYNVLSIVSVLVIITIAPLAVTIVIHIIAIFQENDVYLTKNGLIYFLGYFEFSKCRFSWESSNNPDVLSNTLHIYKPKEKIPFTVSFDRDIETAHKITDENSI